MTDLEMINALCPAHGDKTRLAAELGKNSSACIAMWIRRGRIAAADRPLVAKLAQERGIEFDKDAFLGLKRDADHDEPNAPGKDAA